MSERDYAKLIARNLRRIMFEANKSQADLSRDLGINKATIEVNLEEKYFRGGNKTASGKDVVTPIHSAIYPLVVRRIARDGAILTMLPNAFRVHMYAALERIGIQRHTPHDCKHTFSALCERYGVNERDRKRMLGHRVGDITNDIYGHRTLEDLRAEIEKIQLSKACQKRE